MPTLRLRNPESGSFLKWRALLSPSPFSSASPPRSKYSQVYLLSQCSSHLLGLLYGLERMHLSKRPAQNLARDSAKKGGAKLGLLSWFAFHLLLFPPHLTLLQTGFLCLPAQWSPWKFYRAAPPPNPWWLRW